jgi:hypothetical protein
MRAAQVARTPSAVEFPIYNMWAYPRNRNAKRGILAKTVF